MKKFLSLTYIFLCGVGFVWCTTIYFDTWEKIMSHRQEFELYKYPLALIGLGWVISGFAEMCDDNNETF